MSNENDEAIPHGNRILSCGDVVGEGRGRILNDGHIVKTMQEKADEV